MGKIDKLKTKINISDFDLTDYGNDIYKIGATHYSELPQKGKLILLTAINPTKHGEGKTTCSIGLADALNEIGENAFLALREPSMGPVFGSKGMATGGGECILQPVENINLHFTGDLHAITTANNLISAVIDSHLYWGNELNIDIETINWSRCMDVNDRALRKVEIEIKKNITRKENFVITAASRMMTTLSLAKDEFDLRERLNETIFAFNKDGQPLFLRELDVVGSVMSILKDALRPNLVFSKHGTPAIVHCGPFANIATGTNSVIASRVALALGDYVVTEAGFSSELGFQKYADLISVENNFKPNCVVLVATVRALKEKNDFENKFVLLEKHISNITKVTKNVVVVLNKFADDSQDDLNKVEEFVKSKNVKFALNESYVNGPTGAVEFAKVVRDVCENKNDFESQIAKISGVKNKIEAIAKNYYYLDEIEFSDEALKNLESILNIDKKFNDYPVVIAKSPVTIDGNDKNVDNYKMVISNIELNSSAKFILALTNNVLMMPGLPKVGNYKAINLLNGTIVNLK